MLYYQLPCPHGQPRHRPDRKVRPVLGVGASAPAGRSVLTYPWDVPRVAWPRAARGSSTSRPRVVPVRKVTVDRAGPADDKAERVPLSIALAPVQTAIEASPA
jgi:hypothetical protein